MRYRIEIPERYGAEAVAEFLSRWVDQPALRDLVEIEGGKWPIGDLRGRLDALCEFSERWDFRGGAERLDIDRRIDHLPGDRVEAAGRELGLLAADPPVDRAYDHAVVLGGTALASIYRVQRLYELVAEGTQVRSGAVLTALREVKQPELELVRARPELAAIVDGAETEFDVMVNAVAHFAGVGPTIRHSPHENPHLSSAEAEVGDVVVMAAPSADPTRRANTRDNYEVYVERIGDRDAVLVVTSSIYLPYQLMVAIQALGWSAPRTIEAVGFPPEWMEGILTGPENLLQEVRSALLAARTTLELVTGGR